MQLSSQTLFSTNMPLEKDQSPTDYCPKARNAKNINTATLIRRFIQSVNGIEKVLAGFICILSTRKPSFY